VVIACPFLSHQRQNALPLLCLPIREMLFRPRVPPFLPFGNFIHYAHAGRNWRNKRR
jgi:hypothetical protein